MSGLLTVTEAARDYLREMLRRQDSRMVVFGLDGGGCAGFQYSWRPVAESDAGVSDEIDLGDGFALGIHRTAVPFVIGSTIDYETDFSGSKLTVDNPAAKSACGCGTSVSFDLDAIKT